MTSTALKPCKRKVVKKRKQKGCQTKSRTHDSLAHSPDDHCHCYGGALETPHAFRSFRQTRSHGSHGKHMGLCYKPTSLLAIPTRFFAIVLPLLCIGCSSNLHKLCEVNNLRSAIAPGSLVLFESNGILSYKTQLTIINLSCCTQKLVHEFSK